MHLKCLLSVGLMIALAGCGGTKTAKPLASTPNAGSNSAGTGVAGGAGVNPPPSAAGTGGAVAGTPALAGRGAAGTDTTAAGRAGLAAGSGGAVAGTGTAGTGTGGVSGSTAGVGGTGTAGTGTAGTGTAPPCSGKPGAKRGKTNASVMAGGQRRTFIHYAPASLDPNTPVPLVIIPHGYTQSGAEMFDITKYPAVADREGFVAVFPDGAPNSTGPWDVGSGVCGNGALVPGSGDDQAFVDGMIAFASEDQCIDDKHIFMTGWSMGGYFSHHSGCLRDDIRAIGPHSAGTHDFSSCKTQHKPVIMFHFDPDGLIDYSCGVDARDQWVERNGCTRDAPDVKMVKGGTCEYYKGCPSDGQVAFCTFDLPANHTSDFLAGHAWSGGTVHAYSIAETESAAELGWSFFKTYAW